jgi:cytochrome c biogenesis protein CcmG, thiol:disulfide interchange protein DsbE
VSTTTTRRRVPLLLLFGIALVGLIGLLALVGGSEAEGEHPAATVSGDPLPQPAEGSDPAVGMPAPAIQAETLDGGELSFDPATEGPAAVVFLAHWCPHCQREAPVIQQLVAEDVFSEAGVELVPVTTGIDPQQGNYPPEDWFDEIGWTTPAAVDGDDSVAQAYGLSGYPFWVFVDGEGRVIGRASGELGAEAITSAIQQVGDAA